MGGAAGKDRRDAGPYKWVRRERTVGDAGPYNGVRQNRHTDGGAAAH